MADISIDNTYWDRVRGFLSELRVDARWILRGDNDGKPYGSLRIVSHPDLKPGHLRAYFTYVTSVSPKTRKEKLQTVEDFEVDLMELEVYSIDDNINTEMKVYEAPMRELQELFDVKLFD